MSSTSGLDSKTLVLIGRTGDGKSSTGNTILGRQSFTQSLASNLKDCEKQSTSGISEYSEVNIIDTPGLLNLKTSKTEVEGKLRTIFDLAPNGIDAFLLVLRIGRFNAELQNTVKYFQDIFGNKVSKCTIVVFTGLDDLEFDEVTFEEYIRDLPEDVLRLIPYPRVAFNNRSKSPEDKQNQAELLLKEVVKLGQETRYTKEDFPSERQQQEKPHTKRSSKRSFKALSIKEKKDTKQQLRIVVFQDENKDFVNKFEKVYHSKIRKSVGQKDPFTRLAGKIGPHGDQPIQFLILDANKIATGNKDAITAAFEDVPAGFHAVILTLSIGSDEKAMLQTASKMTHILGNEAIKHTILAFGNSKVLKDNNKSIEAHSKNLFKGLPSDDYRELSIPIKAGKVWAFDKSNASEAFSFEMDNLIELIENKRMEECFHYDYVADTSNFKSAPRHREHTRRRCTIL